jgi:hypothetical protein
LVNPPTALQPLMESSERKLAHSLKFALPRITAPAARRLATIGASRPVMLSINANEPAVVGMGSADSMLSFNKTGMPCSGPRGPLLRDSWSKARACATACGLTAMIERNCGPRLSMASILCMKASTSSTDVVLRASRSRRSSLSERVSTFSAECAGCASTVHKKSGAILRTAPMVSILPAGWQYFGARLERATNSEFVTNIVDLTIHRELRTKA